MLVDLFAAPNVKKVAADVSAGLYDLAKGGFKRQVEKWKAAAHADNLFKKVKQIRLVKTIYQMEKEIDLVTFYHPTKVYVEKNRIEINSLADFKYERSIVLEGTVGQGKSIFLRYLASIEFVLSRKIPVFIELRRLKAGQTILALALQELKVLGFVINEPLFKFLAENGRLILFLDAFDEVREDLRQDIVLELESLLKEFENLRAIVTSRPESGVSSSPTFRVFRLSQLEGNEYESVIEKMADEREIANAIIKGIQNERSQIADVLTTPLMVALLMIRYKIDQTLPQNAASFYEGLFELLSRRHDKSKAGYSRPRKSGLSDVELLDFFNTLCFLTRQAKWASAKSELLAFTKKALSAILQSAKPQYVFDDIIEITNLIIVEGNESKFVHKSVQEYHSALFVKELPEVANQSFFQAVVGDWRWWMQELEFLSVIDGFRFLQRFMIPEYRRALSGYDPETSSIPDILLSRWFCRFSFTFSTISKKAFRIEWINSDSPALDEKFNSNYSEEFSDLRRIMHSLLLPDAILQRARPGQEELKFQFADLVADTVFLTEFRTAVSPFVKSVYENMLLAEKRLSELDSRKDLVQLAAFQ